MPRQTEHTTTKVAKVEATVASVEPPAVPGGTSVKKVSKIVIDLQTLPKRYFSIIHVSCIYFELSETK
jgi:hypothetical protein